MNGSIVFNQVLILFIVMIAGFYGRKINIINEEVSRGLGEILLNITLPLMVITSYKQDFSKELLYNASIIFICTFAVHIFSALIGKLLFYKCEEQSRKVLRYMTVFSNCGFMGFPVLESLFGKIGIFYGSIYVIGFNVFLWTYGIMIFSGAKDIKSIKKAIINPGIISVVIGFIIFLFSIKIPAPIFKAFEMVGSMTTPVSMIVVGAMIATVKVKDMFSGIYVYYAAFIRLIMLPLIVLAVLKGIGIDRTLMGVCVVSVAMPAAANTVIFAEKYNSAPEFASRIVFFTTILSIVTVPLLMMLV